MKITFLITPLLLWVLAVIIGTGKANFLIAGYNTSSKKVKDTIDGLGLAKFMRKFLFILGLIQFILPVAIYLGIEKLNLIIVIVNILFVIVTISGVIYMNTGNRFKK